MPLAVRLLLLSFAAGCVDAMSFVHAGVFPANMTGNTVVLALALARVNVDGLALSAGVLAIFCAGAALGARSVRDEPTGETRRFRAALGGAAILLLLAAAAAWGLGAAGVSLAALLAAGAMGLQGAVVQSLSVAGVSTVVVTGTLTTAIARFVTPEPPRAEAAAGRHLPAASWLAYLAGAFAGGLQSLPFLGALVWLPALLLAGVALAPRR